MTTRNVSSSCEVLWVSRQSDEAARAFFKGASDENPDAQIESIIGQLASYGATWLSRGGNPYSSRSSSTPSGNNYTDSTNSNSDVINCSWNKNTSASAGQFSFQLKPRVPYDKLLKTGDLVVIFMDNDHRFGRDQRTQGTLVTIGILDRITKSTSVTGDGATIEVVSVSGRDLSAIFEETSTVFDPALAVIDQTYFDSSYITRITETTNNAWSPAQNILLLLDLIYNYNATDSKLVGGQWTLPNTTNSVTGRPISLLSLVNVSDFVQSPIWGYSLPQSPGVTQAENVWRLISDFANTVVNEFFFDVRDFTIGEFDVRRHQEEIIEQLLGPGESKIQRDTRDKVSGSGVFNQSTLEIDDSSVVAGAPKSPPMPVMAMVLRQRPYDRDSFRKLPKHDLDYTEVFNDEVSFSTGDVVNFYKLNFPDLFPMAWELIFGVKVNLDSIPRFGLRRFEGQTRYPFVTSAAGDAYKEGDDVAVFGNAYTYYISLISTWWAANELLLAGTISCRFRPEIRVGSRLRHIHQNGDVYTYYIEEVNHSFDVSPGGSRTTLTVVRGHQEGLTDLPNNLIWNADGSGIPDGAVNWGVTDPTNGMDSTIYEDKPREIVIDLELEI